MHSHSAIKRLGVVLKYYCEGSFSISEDVGLSYSYLPNPLVWKNLRLTGDVCSRCMQVVWGQFCFNGNQSATFRRDRRPSTSNVPTRLTLVFRNFINNFASDLCAPPNLTRLVFLWRWCVFFVTCVSAQTHGTTVTNISTVLTCHVGYKSFSSLWQLYAALL